MGFRGRTFSWAHTRILLPPHLAVHKPDARLVDEVDVIFRMDRRARGVVVVQRWDVDPLRRPRRAVVVRRLQVGRPTVSKLSRTPPNQVVRPRLVVARDRLDVAETVATQPQHAGAPLVRAEIGCDPAVQAHASAVAAERVPFRRPFGLLR